MEQKIGMTSSTLEELFAQIREYQTIGKPSALAKSAMIEERIYNAYCPMVNSYSRNYSIKKEDVQGIFDEVFSFVFNNLLEQVIEPQDFNPGIRNIMIKKCQSYNNIKQSRSSAAVSPTSSEIAKQSYLYTLSMLAELNKNAALAKELEITPANLKLLNDFYGLNKEGIRTSAEDLADRYGLSPITVRGRLAASLRKIRNKQAFETTKMQNPDFNFGS